MLVVALCELVTLSWLYGARRLSEDFAFMLAYTPSMFWRVCWAFVSPLLVLVRVQSKHILRLVYVIPRISVTLAVYHSKPVL